jgi:ATP-dependent DNA helicase PIF1
MSTASERIAKLLNINVQEAVSLCLTMQAEIRPQHLSFEETALAIEKKLELFAGKEISVDELRASFIQAKPVEQKPSSEIVHRSVSGSSGWGMSPLHPKIKNNPFLKNIQKKREQAQLVEETSLPNPIRSITDNQEQTRLRQLQAENEKLRTQLLQLQNKEVQAKMESRQPEQTKDTQFPQINGLELNEDFKRALRLIEETSECIFITGKAGTGKSTLLKHFSDNTNKNIALLAFTGVAALHIKGETIHSFFDFPLKPISQSDISVSSKKELYRKLDAIVIDEVSMVRSDIMDGIDYFMRLNGKNNQKPFGGVQVILFGDLYQLPPIVSGEEENKFFADNYRSEYFFDAHVYDDIPINVVELQKIYRQKDQQFIDALNAVRINNVQDRHLQIINSRYSPHSTGNGSGHIILATRNNPVNEINREQLEQLPTPEFIYAGTIEGEADKEKKFPTEIVLRFRKNAQVMFVKNDMQGRWVNGTIGRINSLDENSIQVEIESLSDRKSYIYNIEREKWEFLRHKYNPEKHKITTEVVGAFTQFPLKLAWAITIHKSQGKTFDRVIIDLGNGAFAHGQTYVALSRCTSLNGITLLTPIRRSDIKVNNVVQSFFEKANAHHTSMSVSNSYTPPSHKDPVARSTIEAVKSTTVESVSALPLHKTEYSPSIEVITENKSAVSEVVSKRNFPLKKTVVKQKKKSRYLGMTLNQIIILIIMAVLVISFLSIGLWFMFSKII